MKKYKVEKFKLEDWESTETGLVLDESSDWILIKYIPVDYVIDGYKLLNKKYIVERLHTKHEKKIEQVLKLKVIDNAVPEGFKSGNTVELLSWVENNFELFEFQDEVESEVFYGKIHQIKEEKLTIDFIDAYGIEKKKWHHFEIDKIKVITFYSDYFNSIKLLWKDKKVKSKKLQ